MARGQGGVGEGALPPPGAVAAGADARGVDGRAVRRRGDAMRRRAAVVVRGGRRLEGIVHVLVLVLRHASPRRRLFCKAKQSSVVKGKLCELFNAFLFDVFSSSHEYCWISWTQYCK